ncbi:unnamed protein product [Prorocentrum cordatum]|uniref:RNA-directed RNA polymerase n=1 Tax=Prorocentrum cordatum TaxID=2364126 RepID=A0ABN9Y0E7_9DINO|nr:unnamed protein product [Polarella glacialis]
MAGAFMGLSAGWAGLIDRWGVPALQAWVARCPAVELPPCPACPGCSCPACPPCPGASVGATTGTVALACGTAALAGASLGALGTFTALWLWAPRGGAAEGRGRPATAWAWVLYNVVGALLFHQGRVAGQLALTSDVIIMTPDDMVYAETLLTAGPDISAVRFSATRWPPPPGIDPGATHRFRQAPSAAREAAWLAAAVAEADAEFGRRHPGVPVPPGGTLVPMAVGLLPGFVAPAAAPAAIVGPVPPPDGAAAAPPAAGVAAAALAAAGPPASDGPLAAAVPGPAAGVPIAPGAPPAVGAPPGPSWKDDGGAPLGPNGEAPAGWSWVFAENAGGLAYGSVVQVGPSGVAILAARAGRRAIITLVGGASAMAFILEDWRRGDFIDKWRGADARILARTPGVRPARSWLAVTESAVKVADPSFTLPPRSAGWCVAWLLREGGPIQRHESWRSRKRLNSSDWGVSEHHALSIVLEDLATHDEVNVANLLGAERLLRKMQLIEHFWDEKQRGQDAGQLKLPVEEVSAFMGGTGPSSRPSSMARPALLGVVGKELERISQIKKNARKLREEAKAAAGPKGVHGTFDGSGVERQRDLFPLPVPGAADPGGLAAGGGSLPRAGATLAQQQCLTRVADSVSQLGPPPGDLQPLAALQELQAALSYDGSLSTRAEAMGASQLSLPHPGDHPVALGRLLGAEVFDSVYRVISCKVLPKTEVLQREQSVGFKKPYSDPCLRDPRRYAALVRRLHEAGVVDLVSDAALVVDEVGPFSAAKKSGKQRLVVGARPANFWFGDPGGARLATGAALAAIELPDGANLWTASADIVDAFYNMQLPDAWRPCFALPPLDSWGLGREAAPGQPRAQRLWPRLAVLPMGWPHALAVCQRVSAAAADRAGLPPGRRAGAHLVHVDNFASLALDGDTADRLKDDMVAELRSEGLPVHEEEAASLHAPVLGWVIDGARGAVAPSPRRAWRMSLATRALLAVPRVSAQQVRQVVGHCAFPLTVRRPLLAVFSAVYRFIPKAGEAPRPWWPSVRRELTRWLTPTSGPAGWAEWAALVVAGGVTAALRWIPSEANPADLPSRRALRADRQVLTPAPLVATVPRQAAVGRPGQATASQRGQRRARRSHLSKAAEAAAMRAGRAAARAPEAASLRSSAGHVLGALSISATTRAKCTRLLAEFVAWMTTVAVALRAEAADDLLAHWMGQQCAEGWNPERGACMLAALKFMMPQFGRGVYDEVIPFDLLFYSFLPSALRWLRAATHPGEPLFPFPLVRVSSLFKGAAEDMGLASLTPQLCQLRHSGPSVELALQLQTLASVKLRGRWRTDASVARYLKPGRVNEQLQRLAPEVQRAALLAPARRFLAPPIFVEVFSGEGVLAAALRSEGALAIEWDIAWGAGWDLTDPKVSRVLRGWLDAGLIWGMHFGVPCETWSRVRDTGPLRVPGGSPSCARRAPAPESAPCSGGSWGFLWFAIGVIVGAAGLLAVLGELQAARCCRRRAPLGIEGAWADPRVWHQRLVLGVVAFSSGKPRMIATPDRRVYAGDYSPDPADVAAPTVAQVAAFTAAAVAEAATEAAPAAAQGVAAPAVAAECLLPGVGAAPGPDGRPTRWVAAESFGGHRLGDEVQFIARARAVGNKGVHILPDGVGLFVTYLRPSDEEAIFDEIVAADARTLTARRNRLGRALADMCVAVTKEDFGRGWGLPGCRAAAWCLGRINAEGRPGCPSRSVQHLHLAGAVKATLLVDQLNGANLVAVEMLLRRLQTIEFAREQQASAGLSRGAGQLVICPDLLDVARADVEREAQLSEALRNGGEEREAARKMGGKD